MSKNVQELAEELGIDKNELAAMINGMSLGLMGVTGSTILTPMDVERIKKEHAADQKTTEPEASEPAQTPGPIRRRVKSDSKGGEEVVAPVRRRRSKVSDNETTVVRRRVASSESIKKEDVSQTEPATKSGKIRKRRKVVAVSETSQSATSTTKTKLQDGSKSRVQSESSHESGKAVEVKLKSGEEKDAVAEIGGKASQTIENDASALNARAKKSEGLAQQGSQEQGNQEQGVQGQGAPKDLASAVAPSNASVIQTPLNSQASAPSETKSLETKSEENAQINRNSESDAGTSAKTSVEAKGAQAAKDSTEKERDNKEKSRDKKERSRGSRREPAEPYAAKIVHRPGSKPNPKKKDPIEVEPFQQPRRRGTARTRGEVKETEKKVEQPKTTAVEPKAPLEAKTVHAEEKQTEKQAATQAAKTVRAKVRATTPPESKSSVEPKVDPPAVRKSSSRRQRGSHGEETSKKGRTGATIVNQIDRSVVLDRLSAEGKDFTPGPKRNSSNRERESGRRGRKRVVEGSDLYENSGRRRGRKSKKDKRKPQKTKITEAAEHKRVIRVEDAITVGDLAHQMGVKAGQVAMKLLELGMMATINTAIDYETAAIVAEEFNHTVENVAFDINEFFDTEPDPEDTLETRPPVVTVMGHVDHGKTSLLDAIRSTTVASGEAGGITQHIGAYQVKTDNGVITFLDTPGHEAFTALRARGAQATDITVLVVAADDGVMPQTVEAINHSQAAKVPIVVAINKIDKAGANVDRVKQALTEYNLVPEEWGGNTLYVEVSAKEQRNIEDLISSIMLQAELEELRANYNRDAQGLVIDAQLDVGRGPVATLIVQRGTLKQGDIIVTGQYYGRVRMMNDDRGTKIQNAIPSQPVEITGLGGVPEAGEPFFVVKDEKDAKRITQNVIDRRRKEKLAARARETSLSLEDLSAMIKEGEINELKVILKADVQGSIEALKQAFSKLGNDEVAVAVIHSAVGGVTENDVNLAASSEKGAVVLGFNVRPDNRAQAMAEKFGIKILTHTIIYDAIEQIRVLLEGMLEPIIEEETIGTAEVRDIFTAPKVGTIAGCYITKGLVKRGGHARIVRDSRVVYDSTIASLRRFKDNVNEVKYGYECGLSIENYNDIRIGDVIECYILKKVAAKL